MSSNIPALKRQITKLNKEIGNCEYQATYERNEFAREKISELQRQRLTIQQQIWKVQAQAHV